MTYVNVGLHLETVTCWVCGCVFAVNPDQKENMKLRGDTLFCPRGCRLGLGKHHLEKEIERLRQSEAFYKQRSIDHREEAQRNRERADKTERQLSATKGVVTRIKNRVGKGVCPCCNRTFQDLQRHMNSKHPDYADDE